MKIEHIGIAVKSLETADKIFAQLFNQQAYKHETVESESVTTSFFQLGQSKIELLEASDPTSAIAKFIAKRGEGIHHIAFEVEDIYVELKRLREEGFQVLNDQPKKGADNKLVAFVHPRDCHGVLVELCQEIKNE